MNEIIDPSLLLETKNGYYYGTTIGPSWWKRYINEGWFSRGNGKIWVNKEGIYFRRYLSKKIKHISWESITEIKEDTWHSGKWTGAPVIKITWKKDELELISGFSISWKGAPSRLPR